MIPATIDGVTLGQYMMFIAGLMFVPLAALPFFPADAIYKNAFFHAFWLSFVPGLLLAAAHLLRKGPDPSFWKIRLRLSSQTVLLVWLWGMFIGALPFYFGGQLDFIPALFESVSGWTTTGFSVMNPDDVPPIFLFHRAFMQYLGGLGFVLVMVMFLPGRQAMTLFSGEGHPDRLMPSLKRTARIVFLIYNAFLVVGTGLYILAGMTPFESLCHAMSALSTGGFSTRTASIGAYDNLGVELVSVLLMIIGMTNFYVILQFVRGRWREALRVSEFRFMLAVIAIFTLLLGLSLLPKAATIGEAFRASLFLVTTSLSGTGYGASLMDSFSPLSLGLLLPLFFAGGMSGSTAGGLKLSRVYVLARVALLYIRRRLSPSNVVIVPHYYRVEGRTAFDRHLIDEAMGFFCVYLAVFWVTAILIAIFSDANFADAFFEAASAIGNVGISIGLTGAQTNAMTLIILMFAMFLGRLEIFIVLIALSTLYQTAREKAGLKRKLTEPCGRRKFLYTD